VRELSNFLVKRGLWLVFLEFTIVNFGWFFDIQFRNIEFLITWTLGISMIVLAALVHFPRKLILISSILVIFGHNLLDNVHYDGNIWWAVFHERNVFQLSTNYRVFVGDPLIPLIAVMSLGYCLGLFYNKSFASNNRKRILCNHRTKMLLSRQRKARIGEPPLRSDSFNPYLLRAMQIFPPVLVYSL